MKKKNRTSVYYDPWLHKMITRDNHPVTVFWYDGSFIWYGDRPILSKHLVFIGYL